VVTAPAATCVILQVFDIGAYSATACLMFINNFLGGRMQRL